MSSQKLLRRLLLVCAFATLSVAPAAAQVSEPEFVPYVNDLQIFDQPDLSPYGHGPYVHEGWFGSIEYLNWTQVAPPKTTIGRPGVIAVANSTSATVNSGNLLLTAATGTVIVNSTTVVTQTFTTTTATTQSFLFTNVTGTVASTAPFGQLQAGAVTQTSALDTTFLSSSDYTAGGRMEFGKMIDGHGWLVSGFHLGTQDHTRTLSNVPVNFNNSPIGFVDFVGRNAAGQAIAAPDGVDDDLDRDGIYGRNGVDVGTVVTINNITFAAEPLNGRANFPTTADLDDAIRVPTKFLNLSLENRTNTYGLEAMCIWQAAMGPHGGVWEMLGGPRGLVVTDQFLFEGFGQPGSISTTIDTTANNYILGGQFGARYHHSFNRWQVAAEGRFLGAANFQHVTQQGGVGSLGFGVTPTSTINVQLPSRYSHRANQTEFAPGAELRINLKYYLFRSLYVQAGYTALFVDNIARGAQMTFYNVPNMGILEDQNKTSYFLHGFNFGVVFNR